MKNKYKSRVSLLSLHSVEATDTTRPTELAPARGSGLKILTCSYWLMGCEDVQLPC